MFRIFLILLCLILPQFSLSSEFTNQKFYTTKDSPLLAKKANDYLKLYENSDNNELKNKYLKEAQRYFYICTRADFSNIECHIGLGKTYDEMGVDKYAKMEFNSAYNIDNKNPKLNYRYGDFYYKRKQLSQAQIYFERAYKYGYSNNLDLNKKMSKAYIKLAEPQKAEQHLKVVNEIEKKQKQHNVKLAVSGVIKQSSGVSVTPNTTKPAVKTVKPDSSNIVSQAKPTQPKKFENRFEDAVLKASKIKMIDDVDNIKPMYYLFIK